MTDTRARRSRVVAGALGALVASLAWLAVMPWDLSTERVTESGREVERSAAALRHLLGTALLVIAGVALVTRRVPTRALSVAIGAAAGAATWYAARAGVAQTRGPNPWLSNLLLFVAPGAAIVALAGAALGVRWAQGRH